MHVKAKRWLALPMTLRQAILLQKSKFQAEKRQKNNRLASHS